MGDLSSFELNGLLYSVFFSSMGFYAFAQLILVHLDYKDRSRRYFSRKYFFHVLLAFYSIFELVFAISLIVGDGFVRWGYAFHIIALNIHLVMFAVIINFWKMTLNDLSHRGYIGIIVLSFNFIIAIIGLIHLCLVDIEQFMESLIYGAMALTNSLTLVLLSCGLYAYGYHMKTNLLNSTATVMKATRAEDKIQRKSESSLKSGLSISAAENVNSKIRVEILGRINKVLLIVLACYIVRVASLVLIVVLLVTGTEVETNSHFGSALTFIMSWFIPSLPVVVYMRIMKFPLANPNRGAETFKYTDDDNRNAMLMDDERLYSDAWESESPRFSEDSISMQ